MKNLLLSTALLASLSGCSLFTVYKIDIPQGAPLTHAQAAKVTVGMNKDQVRYLLGSPAITDTLSPNQWDYVFYFTPGTYGKKANIPASHRKQKLSIIFDSSERVSRVIGLDSIPEKQHSIPNPSDYD